MKETIVTLRIEQIDFQPKEWRPCNYATSQGWSDFVQAVAENGLLIEPKCRINPSGLYEPITAFQALLAARDAALTEVQCVACEATDEEATRIAFIAQRSEAEAKGAVLESAWSIAHLQACLRKRKEDASTRAIARRISKSKSTVDYSLRIAAALPRERVARAAREAGIEEAVAVTLPQRAAAALVKLGPDVQEAALKEALLSLGKRGAATRVAVAAMDRGSNRHFRILVQLLRRLLALLMRATAACKDRWLSNKG